MPKAVQELYSSWVDSHPVISKLDDTELYEGLCCIRFFAETEIPWIWKWSLKSEWTESRLPVLTRHYHIKWWSGIIIEDKVKEIKSLLKPWKFRVYDRRVT